VRFVPYQRTMMVEVVPLLLAWDSFPAEIFGFLVRHLTTRKDRPAVQRGCPFFTTDARLYAHRVRDALDGIAEPDFFLNYEAGKANSMAGSWRLFGSLF
jgi:hypothetical protein